MDADALEDIVLDAEKAFSDAVSQATYEKLSKGKGRRRSARHAFAKAVKKAAAKASVTDELKENGIPTPAQPMTRPAGSRLPGLEGSAPWQDRPRALSSRVEAVPLPTQLA